MFDDTSQMYQKKCWLVGREKENNVMNDGEFKKSARRQKTRFEVRKQAKKDKNKRIGHFLVTRLHDISSTKTNFTFNHLYISYLLIVVFLFLFLLLLFLFLFLSFFLFFIFFSFNIFSCSF